MAGPGTDPLGLSSYQIHEAATIGENPGFLAHSQGHSGGFEVDDNSMSR